MKTSKTQTLRHTLTLDAIADLLRRNSAVILCGEDGDPSIMLTLDPQEDVSDPERVLEELRDFLLNW